MTRIYLVDDHQIVREGLRALLQSWGHTIDGESADPTQAMADLLKFHSEVLLLDLNLGERSGFELLADMQRRRIATRCIVLTMSAQPFHFSEAFRLGASSYVLKGSVGSELQKAIDAVVDGRHYLGAGVDELAARAFQLDRDPKRQENLSPRERQVVRMVVQGLSSTEIGKQLHLSPKTVATYRSRLMTKVGASNLSALVRLAIENKWVDVES